MSDHDLKRKGHSNGDGCERDLEKHQDRDFDHDRSLKGHFAGDGCERDRENREANYHDRRVKGHRKGDGCDRDRENHETNHQEDTCGGPRPTPEAPLVVSKTFLPPAQELGYDGNFSIEVTNNRQTVAGPITVTDTLDPLFQVLSATVELGVGECSLSGQSLSCSLTSIAPGEKAIVHLYYSLDWNPGRAPGSLQNCATVTESSGRSVKGCGTMTFTLGPA
ncbi:MAG: DUF11 domain-containing protein [Vicinamibacteria bacterium]|nr:DUF11 domain-containing protein [Vicinamibacteria bacterium]